MIGRTISHYKILDKLGEGGMGVVYRALDTHLDRPVALKILPPEAVANPQRRRRFVQEAKAASALNHPNIVTIYDIDCVDGVEFIAMEYVAGRTLGETIGRRPLRWNETVRYGTQIAGALAVAHAAGIVHRDLKPANIMIGESGQVKVLDFGLAKLTDPGESDDVAVTLSQGLRTEEGAIVGTVAYMSPEQAEGHKLDARSDIFSFGSVLYEMATGRRAFGGESRASILASILREEPRPALELTPGTPPELARLIEFCLRKDPAERLHSVADAKLLLEQVRETAEAAPVRRGLSWRAIAAASALAVVAAGSAWIVARRSKPPDSAPMTLTRLTFDSGLTTDPAISTDGKLVAYASDRSSEGSLDIWVQQVAGGTPIQLTRDPSDDSEPAFSPDGSQIAFRSEREGGGVYVVPALGGQARRIARQGRRPRYSPDGKWIAYWTGEYQLVPAKLYIAAASGGEARQLAADFFSARYPVWSPDSKRILFLGTQNRDNPDYRWWIVGAEGGTPTAVSAPRSAIPEAWLGEPDRAVFSTGQGDIRNLWETPLGVDATPRRLTFGPGVHTGASVAGVSTMVFADLNENLDIWSLPIDADRAKVTGELRRLTQEPSREGRPSVSSDGRRIAFNTFRSGNADAWVKDLVTGRDTGVGVTPAPETGPVLNADGTRVAWGEADDRIGVAPAAGGDAERICQGCRLPTGWSHDGKWIAYELTANRSAPVVEVAGGRKVDILKHATQGVSRVRFSPDDRWLSFHTVSGPVTRQIFVVPFKGPVLHEEKDWIPITDGKAIDRYADWSPDGNLLYFLSEREGFRCFWAQRLDASTKRPEGGAFPVYHFQHARRSLMAMGDPVNVQPTVARDKIVFAMAETTGNIWLVRPAAR